MLAGSQRRFCCAATERGTKRGNRAYKERLYCARQVTVALPGQAEKQSGSRCSSNPTSDCFWRFCRQVLHSEPRQPRVCCFVESRSQYRNCFPQQSSHGASLNFGVPEVLSEYPGASASGVRLSGRNAWYFRRAAGRRRSHRRRAPVRTNASQR